MGSNPTGDFSNALRQQRCTYLPAGAAFTTGRPGKQQIREKKNKVSKSFHKRRFDAACPLDYCLRRFSNSHTVQLLRPVRSGCSGPCGCPNRPEKHNFTLLSLWTYCRRCFPNARTVQLLRPGQSGCSGQAGCPNRLENNDLTLRLLWKCCFRRFHLPAPPSCSARAERLLRAGWMAKSS